MSAAGRHVDELIAELARHVPADEIEAAACAETLGWLTTADDPFDATVAVHVTASALVFDDHGRVLLHRHKRLHRWLQPGGHVEAGERPSDAARRETREETGLGTMHPPGGPDLVHVDAHPGPRAHRHLDLRYVLVPTAGDVDVPARGETGELRWSPVADLAAVADPSLVRAVSAACK